MSALSETTGPQETKVRRRRQKPIDSISIWVKIAGVLVSLYLVLPTLVVIPMSFSAGTTFRIIPEEWSLRWYERFFEDQRWTQSLTHSLEVALTVTVLATVLGTIAALGLTKAKGRWAGAARGFLMLPLVAPGIVIAVVVYIAFLGWGLVGSFTGYVIVHTAMAIPFVLIAVGASLDGFDGRLLQAANSLGANPWRAFWRVQLPLILPGVVSGAVFAFVTSFDEVVVALFIRSPHFETLPVRMFNSVTIEIDPTVAAASALLVVAATLVILATQLHVVLRRRAARLKGNRS